MTDQFKNFLCYVGTNQLSVMVLTEQKELSAGSQDWLIMGIFLITTLTYLIRLEETDPLN